MVRGIKFVGIPVRNQDISLEFYTEALGLKVVTDQPFTDKQRWLNSSSQGQKPAWPSTPPMVTRDGLASFSPLPSGVTTCSQPPRC